MFPPELANSLPKYDQYVLWKPVPSRTRPGKTDKLPVAVNGTVIDCHDPKEWMSAGLAIAMANTHGLGVGFVFTENDPYFFLDIDHARVGSDWTAVAKEMCRVFAGAYMEVSHSGEGLHVIGSGALPPHRTRNRELGMELYSSGRFCALTGISAVGAADAAPPTDAAARLFPPIATEAIATADWTDGPCESWHGPADDDDLVRRMCSSASPAGILGTRATVRQLWEGDEAALGRVFPDPARPFDCSGADAALAQHLAWWTGKDCVRMERLMQRSALQRDKWHDRPEYLRVTILRACSLQRGVLGDKKPPSTPAAAPAAPTPPAPSDGSFGVVVHPTEYEEYFKGCVYIEDRKVIAHPDGTLLDMQQFRARYTNGREFIIANGKKARNAYDAFVEGGIPRPFAHTACFRPEQPSRTLVHDGSGKILFNTYIPIITPMREGDPSPFLRHLAKMLPHEDDCRILTCIIASMVQNPGLKMQFAPLVQGCEGNGKSMIGEVATFCIGQRYTHRVNANDLGNKFNAWLEGKMLAIVEEIHVAGQRIFLDALKVLITNPMIEIQGKNADQITGDNRANFLLFTNHRDAVPKTLNDRRYAVFHTAQQERAHLDRDGMGGDYFPKLYNWLRRESGLEIINHFLHHYEIPAELDPARSLHRAPHTSTTAAAIRASLGPVEQAFQEAIAAEELGFRGGWASSTYMEAKLLLLRLYQKTTLNKWDEAMKALGYELHPALAKSGGRTNNPVQPDARKPSLWVRIGSEAHALSTAAEVQKAYTAAQIVVPSPPT